MLYYKNSCQMNIDIMDTKEYLSKIYVTNT